VPIRKPDGVEIANVMVRQRSVTGRVNIQPLNMAGQQRRSSDEND
jgi:hypothetical protein